MKISVSISSNIHKQFSVAPVCVWHSIKFSLSRRNNNVQTTKKWSCWELAFVCTVGEFGLRQLPFISTLNPHHHFPTLTFHTRHPSLFCSYTTSIARQRAMRFAEMVLALASVSVVSAAPFHVIQLMNLQVSQLTLTFYVSYYISICLSYTSSSINPLPYILPTGNFQKRLRRYTKVEVRMAEQDVSIIENILKSSFWKEGPLPRKMHYLCVDFISCNRWAWVHFLRESVTSKWLCCWNCISVKLM